MRCLIKSLALAGLLAAVWSCGPEERTIGRVNGSNEQHTVFGQEAFDAKYKADVHWLSGPDTGMAARNQVQLKFSRRDSGEELAVDTCHFKVWMKVHGHGGPDREQRVLRQGPGTFVGEGFYFLMPGPWELQVNLAVAGELYAIELPFVIP